VSSRPRTRLGRAADVAVLVLAVSAVLALSVNAARAQGAAPPGMEHTEGAGGVRAGHDDGTGYAHLNRPAAMGDPASVSVAKRLMKELVCLCGGCQRESLYDCKCAYASQEREQVLRMLKSLDLSTEAKRDQAYGSVVAAFVQEYGGEQVLNTPRNQMSWILPYIAIAGGLALLVAVGARWVKSGRAQLAAQPKVEAVSEDDPYAEKLDDELRDID
jgi:cytochrome c-type biogenesis protein CcmH/NrfF